MSKTNREFRKVPSLKFFYEVSEDGRFLRNIKSKKYLKLHQNVNGYWFVQPRINNKHYYLLIHRLVAECWLGPCPEGYEVDHIDKNRSNNDWHNLRYVTHKENVLYACGHQVQWGDTLFPCFRDCARAIAEETGGNPGTIRNYLKRRRHWVHGKPVRYGDFTVNAETATKDSTE